MLKVRNLCAPYCITEALNLDISPTQRVALIGPNGAGKSTLIRSLVGQLVPAQGTVHFLDQDVSMRNRTWIAQRLAVMHQQEARVDGFTVQDIVEMGRYPYGHPLRGLSRNDRDIVNAALASVGLDQERNRLARTLSGGEYQRMRLARAVAQDPKVLVLDEPLAHLDIGHAHEIAHVLVQLSQSKGLTIVAAIHDLNIAAQYFDRIILMVHGQIVADGVPDEVMTTNHLESAFGLKFSQVEHPETGRPQFLGSTR